MQALSEMLGLGGVGPVFLHFFCLLFECIYFMLLSRRLFWSFLVDWGRPEGSLWEAIFAEFADFACKNDMLKLGSTKR